MTTIEIYSCFREWLASGDEVAFAALLDNVEERGNDRSEQATRLKQHRENVVNAQAQSAERKFWDHVISQLS